MAKKQKVSTWIEILGVGGALAFLFFQGVPFELAARINIIFTTIFIIGGSIIVSRLMRIWGK